MVSLETILFRRLEAKTRFLVDGLTGDLDGTFDRRPLVVGTVFFSEFLSGKKRGKMDLSCSLLRHF